MTKIRTIQSGNEQWASVEDLRRAMNDDDMALRAMAMLKTSFEKHKDTPVEAMKRAIAWFFVQGTGLLAHLDN